MAASAGCVGSAGRFALLGGTAMVAAIPVVVGDGAGAALVVALLLRVIDLHACLPAKKAVAGFATSRASNDRRAVMCDATVAAGGFPPRSGSVALARVVNVYFGQPPVTAT